MTKALKSRLQWTDDWDEDPLKGEPRGQTRPYEGQVGDEGGQIKSHFLECVNPGPNGNGTLERGKILCQKAFYNYCDTNYSAFLFLSS